MCLIIFREQKFDYSRDDDGMVVQMRSLYQFGGNINIVVVESQPPRLACVFLGHGPGQLWQVELRARRAGPRVSAKYTSSSLSGSVCSPLTSWHSYR